MTQAEALDILKMGKNVFLTGPAGSGKTHVVNAYVHYLKSHAVDVAVTASTGIAATHIGGQTIHSWSGLGIRDMLSDRDIDDMMQKQYLYKRFEKTKVLVVDEVSMLHHFRLDLVEWICRQMKHNDKPFGGMQVILCGDFFQLPPVTRGAPQNQSNFAALPSLRGLRHGQNLTNSAPLQEFAYLAESWQSANFTICYLSEQHRQKDDTYLSILNAIRENRVTEGVIELLKTRFNKDPVIEQSSLQGIAPIYTKLYTHNIDVDQINHKHLLLVEGKEKTFDMSWKGSPGLAEVLKKSCLSPEKLVLKKGARIMFTKNNPEAGYVNGTLGVVEDFNNFGDPVVRTNSGQTFTVVTQSWKIEEEGKVKAEIMQIPLRLAWAITVHKSQGMSLDAMEVDLSKSFVRGMGYVALSRVRSLNGIKLLGFNDLSLEVDKEVLERDREFREHSEIARQDLTQMTRFEIEKKQEEYLKSIEPTRAERQLRDKAKLRQQEKELHKKTHEITADMLLEEMALLDIADKRKVKPETIVSHIEDLQMEKSCPDIDYLKRELKKSEMADIHAAFAEAGTKTLSPVYNLLAKQKKRQTYLKIRLARLFLPK